MAAALQYTPLRAAATRGLAALPPHGDAGDGAPASLLAQAAAAWGGAGPPPPRRRAIVYAYHETPSCAANLAFLLANGGWSALADDTSLTIVVNGRTLSVALPAGAPAIAVLLRENEGLDFGAYASAIDALAAAAEAAGAPLPELYGFLNCGVTGPFLPAYLPLDFDWFDAFSSRLSPSVRLVGAYLTCLTPIDAGGHGPRIEGHSFFTDLDGVRMLQQAGVLRQMRDKYDAIVNGEFGLTRAVFAAGGTIDSLLYRYQGVNWRDEANWDCNGNRFVGRGGGLEGGDVNPFEVIFFKRVWPTLEDPTARTVRYAETARYMHWRGQWARGGGGVRDDAPAPTPPPAYYDPGLPRSAALKQ